MLVTLWAVACLLLWFAPAKLPSSVVENQGTLPVARFLQTIFPTAAIITNLVCLLLTIVNGVLLYQLNNVFTLIREKTFLLFLIFMILTSSFHSTHYNVPANLSLTFFLISVFNFLKMYHNTEHTEAAFLGSLLIACVGWLLFPEFLLLFVALWLGMLMLRAMSLRIFLASLIGLVIPAIFCFVFSQTYFDAFFLRFQMAGKEWQIFLQNSFDFQFIFFCILLIIWILSLIGIFTNALHDTVRTRINLNFMLFVFITVIVITIYFPQAFYVFLPLLSSLFAVFFAHPVTLRNSNFFNVVFIVFCAVNVIYVCYNIIANYL